MTRLSPHCFGNPAIPIPGTRGFASPPYDGFAFVGQAVLSW